MQGGGYPTVGFYKKIDFFKKVKCICFYYCKNNFFVLYYNKLNTNERYPFRGRDLIGKRETAFCRLPHCLRNRRNALPFFTVKDGKERGRYAMNCIFACQSVISRETCRAF